MPKGRLLLFDREAAQRERVRQGLTLRELADRCEKAGRRIDHTSLNRWENGEFAPTAPRLKILARALNVEVDALLTSSVSEIRRESA